MSTPITIKQACERVEKLRENIEACENLRSIIKRSSPTEFASGVGHRICDRWVTLSVQNTLDILEVQQLANKAEIERLQPVIEMANAALRGVLT